MKAAITDGKGKVWIEDILEPEPDDYQCLCEIKACATCSGTDSKHIENKLPWNQDDAYPGILGHESVGTVVKVGTKVKNIKPGARFLRPSVVYPGEKLAGYGSLWGGFAEKGVVTDTEAFLADHPDVKLNPYMKFQQKLPDDCGLSDAEASMLITLKEAASYVESAGAGLYKSLLILGSGTVALSMLRFAKIFGAYPVIVAGRRDAPLKLAQRIGADFVVNSGKKDIQARIKEITAGKGVDFILDTTGSPSLLISLIPCLTPGGKVAPYATYPRGKNVKEMIGADKVVNAVTHEDLVHQYLISAVKLSLVNPQDFYSHTMPLTEIAKGFEMIKNRTASKIVFEM